MLSEMGMLYEEVNTSDVNDPHVIAKIKKTNIELFVYSGYGGVIVSKYLLETDKSFLHIHAGYLPDYKGSTTNYYSYLSEREMGASAIFLTSKIDSGPIILRRKYKPPKSLKDLDHIYDPAIRARLLVETLQLLIEEEDEIEVQENSGGDLYFIIHPVLKHIAIMSKI